MHLKSTLEWIITHLKCWLTLKKKNAVFMVPERKKTGSSNMNVFNIERIFLRFDAVKTHNSQFDLIEISHSRCTRKNSFTILRNKKRNSWIQAIENVELFLGTNQATLVWYLTEILSITLVRVTWWNWCLKIFQDDECYFKTTLKENEKVIIFK